MQKILSFITHKTLSHEHADLTFFSLSNQNTYKKFDILYIYNSHDEELPNDDLLKLYKKYDLQRLFNTVEILKYDPSTPKCLGADFSYIKNYCISNHSPDSRVLILKSDCLLSINYFDEILNIDESKEIYFVAPFICAKKRVSNEEIIEYTKREKYIPSDEITFFVEDKNQSQNNDFYNRTDTTIESEKIKFTSCYVIRDFSCHYMTINLMDKVMINNQSWGGVNFSNLYPYHVETNRCFVVHKYHDIVSENRSTDREGPVSAWLNS